MQDLTPELVEGLRLTVTAGAIIARVVPGSPAAEAGLRRGDVITQLDGEPVRDASSLRNKIGLRRIGDKLLLTIVRRDATLSMAAEVRPVEARE